MNVGFSDFEWSKSCRCLSRVVVTLFYSRLKGKKKKRRKGIGRRTVENGQWAIGNFVLSFFSFFFHCLFYLKILLRVLFRLEILALRSKWCLKDSISAHWSGYTLSDRFSGQSAVNEWSVNDQLIVSLWLIKDRYVIVNKQLAIG